MQSILLHVGDDPAFPSRLQAALDLVRQFDGQLTCSQVISYDVPVPGDYYGSAAGMILPIVREAAEKLREETEQRLRREGVSYTWTMNYGVPTIYLAARAALEDVVIAGPVDHDGHKGRPSQLVGWAVTALRTPVLVPPVAVSLLDVDRPVLVAWNGSPESGRAVRSALPVLRRARSVVLSTVAEHHEFAHLPPLEAAEYLSRHGVAAELRETAQAGESIAQRLLAEAESIGAGMIVMGAYGHSRLREMIFGGVTRQMLSDVRLPLLLSN